MRVKRKTPFERHSRLHECSYWAGRANVKITEWASWSDFDRVDFTARCIIEDAREMVQSNIEDIDDSEFVTPIKNDVSFQDWLSEWSQK